MPNSKVLESKKAIVDALADKLQNASSAVFVDYKGITVAQDTELRKKFREAGVEYSVVKNTLTRLATNKAGYHEFDEMLNGTTAMASTTGDPIAPARIVCEFAKKNKNVLSIKGGLVEGSSRASASCPARTPSWRRCSARSSHPSPLWPASLTRSASRRKAPLPPKKLRKPDYHQSLLLGGYLPCLKKSLL